ncbi:MAG: tRNA (adenosine(37)-N6)-dimethylallyltransferase MiaA [Acidimicrobiales bacterium]
MVGATATGKTALAARIADEVEGVGLVSVDAFAVYRGIDIATGKPTRPGDPASRHPWQLVDIADATEEFSVAAFQRAARAVIRDLHSSGRPVVLVGGTGLYHRAVLDDLELPGRFPDVAARLRAEADRPGGFSRLHDRLRELDPVAAGRITPDNARRIVRALEVTEGSGRRFSDFGPGLSTYLPIETVMIGLSLERSTLEGRLSRRLEVQMAEGLIDEVETLLAGPGVPSRTASQAIGYEEIRSYLEGACSLEAALSAILRRLKAFARRQEAWFRRDPRVHWFRADDDDLPDLVVKRWETGPQ